VLFDFKPTDNTSYTLRAVFNRFIDDHENRQLRVLFARSAVSVRKGIAAREYLESASPTDIAPALAFLAGVTLPRVDGRVLAEGLSGDIRPARTSSAR
jgi:hypothetical protein